LSDAWVKKATILSKVGRHHFAFMRGYYEGIPLDELTYRYLETAEISDIELRVAKSVLRWIRDELMVAARRRGQHSFARLININRETFNTPAAPSSVPSLEDFRAEYDPDEMYGEAELLELFNETFKGKIDRKAHRNARLRERQLTALYFLETLIAVDPKLDDLVAGWLDTALANRLNKSGIYTLRELVECINGKGYRWWVKVPRFGLKAAERVVKWLDMNSEPLGIVIGAHVRLKNSLLSPALLTTIRPIETAIVPLEFFKVPANLDGSAGANRGEFNRNKLRATNDMQAILSWLSLFPNDGSTFRSYRKEAERFLLWSIFEAEKPISSLRVEDCVAYREFINDLGRAENKDTRKFFPWRGKHPQSFWIGKRHVERWSSLWKPFEGNLSLRSQTHAVTVLRAMCEWLMRQRYLDSNPWDGVPPKDTEKPAIQTKHSFTRTQWASILETLNAMDKTPRYYRLRFILLFLYGTGLRLSEIASATFKDITEIDGDADQSSCYALDVLGKGKRRRQVPIPDFQMSELRNYIAHRGFNSLSECTPETPLIGKLVKFDEQGNMICDGIPASDFAAKISPMDVRIGISDQAIYQELKAFFQFVAKQTEETNKDDAAHIQKASTHWMRHTCGSHAIANKVPVEILRDIFGHASIDTTSIYVQTEIIKQREFMNSFMDSTVGE